MSAHGAITGHTPGNMIGGLERRNNYAGEYVKCPECGEPMRYTSKLCRDCHVKTLGQVKAIDQDRKERFDLALKAGWTLEDIFGFDPDEEYVPGRDKLPTREQIEARAIE